MVLANQISWHDESRRRFTLTAAGALTSWVLFFMMQGLVSYPMAITGPTEGFTVDWTRLIKDTAVAEPERPLPEPDRLTPPPIAPTIEPTRILNPGDGIRDSFFRGNPVDDFTEAAGGDPIGTSNQGATPLVRVDPNYPPRAKQQGIEGFVDLQFTITPAGTISDVRVIHAEPPAIFDREAIRAVQKWRYNPMVEAGTPVSQTRQSVRLQFELPTDGRR